MSDLVPDGWEVKSLGAVIKSCIGGVSVNSENRNIVHGEFGVIKTSAVANGIFYPFEHKAILPSEIARAETSVTAERIIFSRMNTPSLVGQSGYVKISHQNLFLPDRLWLINTHNQYDTQFFSYVLRSEAIVSALSLVATGTSNSMKNISKLSLMSIKTILPPLPEQHKISKILSSVDTVIEQTQAQIDKLTDLKTAMMQELLTKGIGHSEFKDSAVGRIPVDWEVKPIAELSSFVTSGSRGWAQYYSQNGALFIRIGNLTREHINFRFKDTIYVNPPSSAEGQRTKVMTSDVLVSITADLGIVAVANDSIGEAYVNQHVALVRLLDKTIARWVGNYLAFEKTQSQFVQNNDAGAKAGLNLTAIRNIQVAIPPITELEKITASLDCIDKLVVENNQKLTALKNTKAALMQDLLTGKVRVTPDATNQDASQTNQQKQPLNGGAMN